MTTLASQRRQVTYSGHVQGVGFRYTAKSISRSYAVTGFVRNLPDRRVELVAEGACEELDGFFDELAERMSGQIRSVDSSSRPAHPSAEGPSAEGGFAEFEIRY